MYKHLKFQNGHVFYSWTSVAGRSACCECKGVHWTGQWQSVTFTVELDYIGEGMSARYVVGSDIHFL